MVYAEHSEKEAQKERHPLVDGSLAARLRGDVLRDVVYHIVVNDHSRLEQL